VTTSPESPDPTTDELFEPGMFPGPRRIHAIIPWLRRLPAGPAREGLAGLAIAHAVVGRRRWRQASRWAEAQGLRGWHRNRLALSLLANHGRFVADEAMLGVSRLDDLARGVELRGQTHLDRAGGGAILLGFHLGPPHTRLVLRALGYHVRFAGRLESATADPRWARALETGEAVRMPDGSGDRRLPGLIRLRNLIREGALVYLTADGPFGREACRLTLPGGPLIVRAGWIGLSRQTRVPVLPVVNWLEGSRRVIVVHPPLPAEAADGVETAVQAALTPLIAEYVRRFPAQCRYLAFPPWLSSSPDSPPGPAGTMR
jgi:lauroyl/myristoyl acyltransferase